MMITVDVHTDCFICGATLQVTTEAKQVDGEGFLAYDGDPVKCPDCGAAAWISADEDGANVLWDEQSEHNRACYEKYEAREAAKAAEAKPEWCGRKSGSAGKVCDPETCMTPLIGLCDDALQGEVCRYPYNPLANATLGGQDDGS